MAFDINTARPVDTLPKKKGKFDISTARPVSDAREPDAILPADYSPTRLIKNARGAFPLGLSASPLGLIPTNKEELADIPRVVGRQVIPGARGEEINWKMQGPFGVGVNMAGIKRTNGFIEKPKTEYGQGAELASDYAGIALTLAAGAPAIKAGYNAFKLNRAGGPEGAIRKAEDDLIKILQPQAKKLNNASKKGLRSPEAITKSLPYVKPSKTYDELATNLGKSKRSAIRNRNKILRSENFRVGEDYLLPLQDEVNLLKDPRRTPQTPGNIAKAKEMERVLNAYKDFNQGRGFNRVQAQAEKVRLQRETEPLLKRLAAGENIARSPYEIQALDKIRHGLMKVVAGGNPEIERLNDAYAALRETESLARNQANLARKTTPTLLEKIPIIKDILSAVARGRAYPEQVALRALNMQPSLQKRTKNITNLYELAQRSKPKVTIPKVSEPLQISQGALPKGITGPKEPKMISASSEAGEGFQRISDPEQVESIRQAFAEKLRKEAIDEFAQTLLKPEGLVSGGKKTSPKSFGLNPFSGEIKYGKPLTALQAAIKRRYKS